MAAARLAAHSARFVGDHVGRVSYHTGGASPRGGVSTSTADVPRVLPVLVTLHVELGMGTSATCYICAGRGGRPALGTSQEARFLRNIIYQSMRLRDKHIDMNPTSLSPFDRKLLAKKGW